MSEVIVLKCSLTQTRKLDPNPLGRSKNITVRLEAPSQDMKPLNSLLRPEIKSIAQDATPKVSLFSSLKKVPLLGFF